MNDDLAARDEWIAEILLLCREAEVAFRRGLRLAPGQSLTHAELRQWFAENGGGDNVVKLFGE